MKQIKDLCNSKDKVIQNNKMILKFRDSALQRMEKAHKEKVKLSPEDKDKIIVHDFCFFCYPCIKFILQQHFK